MFSKKSQYPIGLDISDYSLKAVQLGKSGDKIKIQGLGKINLPEGVIVSGEIRNVDKFKENVRTLLSKPKFGSFSSSEVVASLPSLKTFIKLIRMEKTPNRLKDIIETEIEKEIPVSIENTYYDWQVMEERSDYYKILAGIAPKDLVNQYIEALRTSKLSVVALEIESIPISRALLREESPTFGIEHKHINLGFLKNSKKNTGIQKISKNEDAKINYGIIDLGENQAKMIIYARNSIITSISMPISGQKITKQIAESLEIDDDQAEKAKIICGLDKHKAQGIINEILTSDLDGLIKKIKMTIAFFETHYSDLGPINEILLSGGSSDIKDLDRTIEEALTIKTSFGNNFLHLDQDLDKFNQELSETRKANAKFLKIKQNKPISLNQNSSQGYTTAIGLALRNIFICND